jgi:hypothetical protein
MKTEAKSWPFEDPTNVAVFSTRQIIFGQQPILHVTHDADDGSWQFLGAETPSENDLTIAGLEEICNLDSSITKLADLPVGWEAWRRDKATAWKKIKAD